MPTLSGTNPQLGGLVVAGAVSLGLGLRTAGAIGMGFQLMAVVLWSYAGTLWSHRYNEQKR